MQFKNAGSTEDQVLQNRFTAYLLVAIRRKKAEYSEKRARAESAEQAMETDRLFALRCEGEEHWLEQYMESQSIRSAVLYALQQLQEKEQRIVLEHLLLAWTFSKIAIAHGMQYKTAAAVYYRAIQKIRRELKRTDELL